MRRAWAGLLFFFLPHPSPLAAQDDETWAQELRLAIDELDKGRLSRAQSKLDDILEAAEDPEPDRPPAEILRTAQIASWRIAELEGSYRDLLRDLAAAPAEDRADPRALRMQARVRAAVGEYEPAMESLAARLEAEPHDHQARELFGRLLAIVGRHDDARAQLRTAIELAGQKPPEQAPDLAAVARCHVALGTRDDLELASVLAVEAIRRAPEQPDGYLVYGELKFLAYGEAAGFPSGERDYQKVLEQNGDLCEALIGLYRLRRANMFLDPGKTEALLVRALGRNPNHVPAIVEQAALILGDRRFQEGRALLARALEINPRDPLALAWAASAAMLLGLDDEEAGFLKRAHALDATTSLPDRVAGELLCQLYRFADAVPRFERALERSAQDVDALQGLARALIYTGRGKEAVAYLQRAAEAHPGRIDAWRRNQLALEELLSEEYKRVETEGFEFLLHRDDLDVLATYLVPLHQEARDVLGDRYRLKPAERVRVEVLHGWADFSVRTIGFRGFSALGACFGRLITLVSPRDQDLRRNDFMWSATVWHEYAHVLTLALSKNRVPRWLTEGVSVYEEKQRNPAWERGMQRELLDAWHNGDIVPLRLMNRLFRGPRILFGYYQGGLIVEYLTERHGFAEVLDLVRSFGDDQDTETAFQAVFGETTRAFDEQFLTWVWDRKLRPLKMLPRFDDAAMAKMQLEIERRPDDLELRAKIGTEWMLRGIAIDAANQLREILRRDPTYGPGLLLQGRILARRDAHAEAAAAFAAGFEAGAEDFDARIAYGRVLEQLEDVDGAVAQYQAAKACWPGCTDQNVAPEVLLYRVLRAAGRTEQAWMELKSFVRRTGRTFRLRLELAEFENSQNNREEEARLLEEALQIDPFMRELHVRLGNAYRELRRYEDAAREYQVAIAVPTALDRAWLDTPADQIPAPDAPQEREARATIALELARMLRLLRKDEEAFAALQRAEQEGAGTDIADAAAELRREWGR